MPLQRRDLPLKINISLDGCEEFKPWRKTLAQDGF